MNPKSIFSMLLASGLIPLEMSGRPDGTPNFIIILADDMGYGDLSCYGSKLSHTPNIDALARSGIQFTDGHSNGSLSTPTRAALLTGRYQQRAGMEGVLLEKIPEHRHAGLPVDQLTFARILSENGYHTCLYGKWHLGADLRFSPTKFGFQEFQGFLNGNVDYFSKVNNFREVDWWKDGKIHPVQKYTTTLIAELAVEYIEEHKNEPFCLFLSESCPHGPLQGPDDYTLRLPGKKPGSFHIEGKEQAEVYKNMIEELDRGVGLIMRQLRKARLENNTLVVFLSDNGPQMRHDGPSAGQFRGAKNSMFEGGHRVPFIISMPGTVPAGLKEDTMVMTFDLFPTFMSLAGISCKGLKKPLDGLSLLPLFQGKGLPHRTVCWSLGPKMAIRDGKWKYIERRTGGKMECFLFDIMTDKEERNNLYDTHRNRASRLRKKLYKWYHDVRSEVPEQLSQYIWQE